MQDHEFLQFFPRLRPLALSIGRQFFGNTEDAEDVAQDTMLRLWAARTSIDPTRPLELLVTKVAKNVCVSMWRRRQNESPSVPTIRNDIIPYNKEGPQGSTTHAPDPQTLLEEREDAVWLEHRLRALPEYLQRVLRMKQEEGLTAQQIAEIIGTDPRSVQTLISKARKQLMNDLKQRYRNE